MSDDDSNMIDEYQLISPIATGSTTQVWEVQEGGPGGRTLAMKLMLANVPDKAAAKATLRMEAAVGKTLDHPNIIRNEKLVIGRDHSYLLMEYFRAVNVKLQIKGEPAALQSRIAKYIEGTCQAMAHLHQKGWIHRDFKPENVLMNRAGEVKLIDFSLAMHPPGALSKLMGGGSVKVIQGTRMYLAPETILKRTLSFQTDMYSYGVTLFEIVTGGKMPFQGSTPQELLQKHIAMEPPMASSLNPNVTPEMDRVIQKLMAKKPQNRYKDFQEINSELRRIRIFKEDVVPKALDNEKLSEEAKIIETLGEVQVDSRADVLRQQMIRDNPELGARHAAELERRKQAKAKKAAAAQAPQTRPGSPPPAAQRPQPPGGMPPQSLPPGMMPPGAMPQNPYAPSPYGPPGNLPPNAYPPGMTPAAMVPPGMVPPGMVPPGMMPPGSVPPGMLPPGSMPPGLMPQPGIPPQGAPRPAQPGFPAQMPRPAGSAAPIPNAPPAGVPMPSQNPPMAGRPPQAMPPKPPGPGQVPPRPSAPHPTARGSGSSDDDLEVMTELPDVI